MTCRTLVASLLLAQVLCAAAVLGDITTATLQIQGVALEVETVSVTTGVDISTTIQTKFGGKTNDAAAVVDGLLAVGELSGPGIDTPIQLTTAPGHRFQIPGFSREGVYILQNVRLMKGSDFVAPATPSVATITVANLLQTSVKVHQLTLDELRARGIVLDGRNFTCYEYSFSFLINGQTVEIPFPVIIDPRTHEVTPIRKETPFSLPPVQGATPPPRWSPPDIVTFELPAEEDGDPRVVQDPLDKSPKGKRPTIPAAIVIPNSFAVLHQFFAVLMVVSNGAPAASTATLTDLRASIKVPTGLRTTKTNPTVAFGQPVPIVDATNGVTFLVAQARGEAEWTLEGLAPGTHTVDIEVRATLKENGQADVPLKATPRASIVVHDPRFNITFSHPDVVRKGIDYSTYSFITNTSAVPQTIRVGTDAPSCDQVSGANVCRVGGTDVQELTLAAGEMRMVEYKLRPGITGNVFATAGTVDGNITAAVQLHVGVSESGIPLSPATLLLPYYTQFLPSDLVDASLRLLGLGYSLATAPVTQATANLPRVIKTDVFYRAVDLARAGQQIFIGDSVPGLKRDVLANLTLDLLGNSVELSQWDELRRAEKSGRIAGASVTHALQTQALANNATIGVFVDSFGAATAHRDGYVVAIVHGPSVAGIARPYAVSLRAPSGARADVPNEANGGWIRDVPFADIARLEDPSGARAGEIALAGQWTDGLEIGINPAASGPISVDLLLPGTAGRGVLRAHIDLAATAGQVLRIPITAGATTINAVLPDGGFAASAAENAVIAPPLAVIAARQDLYLDPEGHKVSVLFNRPIGVRDGVDLRTIFAGAIAFNRDGVNVNGPRPIFAAAMQDGHQIVNLSFDHVLTTNASYTITVSPLHDPVSSSDVSFGAPVVPKIDNDRPAAILFGKFLKGDNSAIGAAEVRLYTGHYRGCASGFFDDPPMDCNPYREAPQYAKTEADGSFLFEYVPRDPIADEALAGGYRLIGVDANGRFTILNGAVRLPGRVHFVNLQLLGRGAAEGTVRYDNGEKVAKAQVFVGSTMFSIGRSATTNASGFFHVDDLPVGPITFSATDVQGNVGYASAEIATPGQLVTKDVLIYRKPFPGTGSVSGVVRRSDTNGPVAGAHVGVFSQGYGLTDGFTDSDGHFDFRGVPAGFVTLLASEWTIAREAGTVDFDLKADEVKQIDLLLSVQPTEGRASVSGDVIRENPLHPGDTSKYERVAGAIVRIGRRPPVTADPNGHFTLDNLPLSFGNSASVEAYDPSTKRIGSALLPTLTEAGPNNVTVFLPAHSYGSGTIRLQLLNAAGVPVSGFRVIEPGFPPTVLNQIGPGVYQYASASVGAPVDLWAVTGPAQYGDQTAHGSAKVGFPGQVVSVTLRLPGQGKVLAGLQSDIAVIGDVDLSYMVWDEAEQGPGSKSVTVSTRRADGTAGAATFSNVPALVQYTVSGTHPSYGHAEAFGTLAYDGDLTTHTLQFNRLSTVRGTIYAIDGITPIAAAAVRLNDGRRDTGVSVSQPDGTFAFFDVPSGITFTVVADATQSGIYRTGIAYGRTSETGGAVSNVNVIMRRRGSVEGRVVYANYKHFDPDNPSNNIPDDTPGDLSDNAAVPLARVWLRELDFPNRTFGSDADPLTADVAGRFAISNVFVGSLRARAWDPGNQELLGDWTGALQQEGEVLSSIYIGVGAGGTGSIVVAVGDPNQQSAPVPNAEVGLYRGGLFDLTSSDAYGVARFEQVPIGTYSVSAYSKALGKSGGSGAFVVERDATSNVRILLELSGRVDGTLSDPESVPPGKGLPGIAVTLSGPGFQSRASTDPAGAFSFDGVREGLFTLDAKEAESNRRASASHTLSAADPHPIVNLALERTETLHVAVYLPDDTGGSSGVLAGPVVADVTQRCFNKVCDFQRSVQGNPITVSKLFLRDEYGVTVREIGGEGRSIATSASFPKGSSADPLQLLYRAFGNVSVVVMQSGAPAAGARVSITGAGKSAALVADATGTVTMHGMPLGDVFVQAVSIDGGFSGSASGRLDRQSVSLSLAVDLGAYAGVTGVVEAERGGPSISTRVLCVFSGRTLEVLTDADGRYTFQGIPTQGGGITVALTYVGPDGITVGARQSITLFNDSASRVVGLPNVKLDATPPQLVSISPDDGAANVSPDSPVRFVFSEAIRADQISNSNLQLVPADGTGQVIATFDAPVSGNDGTFAVMMRPPPPPPGQRFPLKSNTLYRVIVSGAIEDLTGHRLPAPRGITFTTSDYTEPRVIKTLPSVATPVPEQVTFQFLFNEAIDPAPWQTGGGASFRFFKISTAGPGGQVISEKTGRAYVAPTSAVTLNFAPDNAIEPESFYRVVFSGIRDLQGNALGEQTFHFFSFDRTKPFVRLISPVPDGFALISGVEYQLVPDIRNGALDAPISSDVAFVDYLRVDGVVETYVTTVKTTPFAYKFVAPEAPAAGSTLTLRARATDLSGNISDPATITWTVKPNAAPTNVAVSMTPSTAYPGNTVTAHVSFGDEGTFATAQVVVHAARLDGSDYTESKTKQVMRAAVGDSWSPIDLPFTFPPNLKSSVDAMFTATVTDVRGLATNATAALRLLTDSGRPVIEAITPAPETSYHLNDRYTIQANVSDLETGVASVDFVVDGSTYHVTTSSGGRFVSPPITVPAKNVDTRIPISVVATDYQGNSTTRSFELIYIGVNDPSVPKGVWSCPLDRAVVPANQTSFVLPLRLRATDDLAVTSVQFRVPGITDPIVATRVGGTDEYQSTATIHTPAAGSDFVITGVVKDADSTHTIELPIAIDVVAFDSVVDATQAITFDNLSLFTGRSVLVRGSTGRLVTHVPVTLANLAIIDGARVESLGTTTTGEQRVDMTIADRLYVDCSSSIDVTGKGYLGGYGVNPDGSNTRNESPLGRTVGNTATGGASNAGGAHAGLGSEASGGATNAIHGSLTDPTDPGSGGSGTTATPGAPGGGAISLRWTGVPENLGRFVVAGAVRADGGGGSGFFRSGSGGSVRLRARSAIVGPAAHITANGGVAPPSDGTGVSGAAGGGGRVAIFASDRADVEISQLEARGGELTLIRYPYPEPGAGTIFLHRPGQASGELIVSSYASPSAAPHFVRATPLGYIGSGTATKALSSSITDATRVFVRAAIGEELLLGADTTRRYTITDVSADGHTLLTDPADGDLTAASSSSYRGLLSFDRIEIGPYALARFDESFAAGGAIDEVPSAVRDATATILRFFDSPAVSAMTSPDAQSNVIRATSIDVVVDASSIAGLRSKTIRFTAAPGDFTSSFSAYPTTIAGEHTSIAVPSDAALGAASMVVRVIDRADRVAETPARSFTIVDNLSATIDAFGVTPDSLYPGRSVTATISASDDVAITRLTLTSQIGSGSPSVQTLTPNVKTVSNQAFTIPVPVATAGGVTLTIDVAAEDAFPGRAATKQTKTVAILKDTNGPTVTIASPSVDQLFEERTGVTIPIRITAIDSEVAVKTVSAKVGDAAPLVMTPDPTTPNGWLVDAPVPSVDGTDSVPISIVVTASDYEGNPATATRQILVKPLYDPNAPVVRFLCPTSGGLFPPGYPAKLRVFALGNDVGNAGNGISKIELFVDGSSTAIVGTPVIGVPNAYETTYSLPADSVEGRPFSVRAVATNAASLQSDVSTGFLAATGTVITSDRTVVDGSLDNLSVIVQSGTLTLSGNRTFSRLIVLDGANVTHAAGSRLNVTSDQTFVACTGSIDATGRGYGGRQTYPGATLPADPNGGSHIGRGATSNNTATGSTFGSVYRPQELGSGGPSTNGEGGGAVRITAFALIVDGAIRANGTSPDRDGGGGSIWITAGKISGVGTIEANGGGTTSQGPAGGGGAIAIEYTDTTTVLPPSVRAKTGGSCCGWFGGAGSVYIKGPSAIFGDLTLDNGGLSGQPADLPSLGRGAALSGSSGATLVTDRATDIPAYFAGHWVEITNASGTLKGTWRIATITNRTVTLQPNATESIAIDPGDKWQGVYRFDHVKLNGPIALTSTDPIRLPATSTFQLNGPTGQSFIDLIEPIEMPAVSVSGNLRASKITTPILTINSGAVVTPRVSTLTLEVSDTLRVSGTIDATGRGYAGRQTYPGATLPADPNGGSHIGRGATSNNTATGSTFGSVYRPQELGSGGPSTNGEGGGAVRITASALIVDGAIRANGTSPDRDGGGGSIWITAGKISGVGTIEANGGGTTSQGPAGGGGAIAIEYTDTTTVLPPSVRAKTGGSCCGWFGGAGSVYIKGPSAIFGNLTLDNGGLSGQPADLPSLGRGAALSGSSGATLVTDRATDIPAYFAGHWVEITNASGTLKGTWRIATITNRTVTLQPNATESIAIDPGDKWQGIYRLDHLKLRSTTLVTADRLVVTNPFDLDASSTIKGNNQGPPVLNAALIYLQLSPTGSSIAGLVGAVSDPDAPLTGIATNTRTGGTFIGAIGASGSFVLGVQGDAGDTITIKARDANMFPLESNPIVVGSLSAGSPTPTQLDKSAWTTDGSFKPQTLKLDGNVLAVASSYPDGARSDKLVVLDASDPSRPTFVRTVATAGPVLDVELRDGWAFVVGDRFTTIDLHDTTSPLNFANSDPCGREQAIAVSGNYAYTAEVDCANNGRVFVYDISDPAGPRFLSFFDTAGVGNHQYTDLITYGTGYLVAISPSPTGLDVVVIDRRDSLNLSRLSTLAIADFGGWRGHITGALLYLASNTESEMVVVDLTNPKAPTIAGRLPLPSPAGSALPVGDTVLVPATTAGLVTTTASPAQLVVTGSVVTGGVAYDVAASSNYAYVANETGVSVIALSVPPIIDPSKVSLSLNGTILTITGAYRSVTGQAAISAEIKDTSTGASITVTVNADGSFSASIPASAGDSLTLKATDALGRIGGPLSIGAAPFGSSTFSFPIRPPGDSSFRSRAVKVEGNLAVLGGFASSETLVVYDISNSAPVQTRAVQAGSGPIIDFELRDGWAYVVGDRFTTIDLKNPSSARNFANVDPCGREHAVAVAGGYAFTSEIDCANNGRVFVYDVTDPAAPIFQGSQDLAGISNHVFTDLIVYGSDYLIGLSSSGSQRDVMIIDRRDPKNMKKVGELQIAGLDAFRGKLIGTILYAAGLDGGVAMVDVSNAASPRLLSTFNTSGLATGIDVSGSTVIVADRGDGLAFLDAAGAALRLVGTQSTGGDAWDVALGGANLYVANELGLFVISNVVAPPTIEPAFITVTIDGSVTGRTASITGHGPINAEVGNTSSGVSISVTVNADGSFSATIPASAGDVMTVKATDALGRVAGPVVIGAVPFGFSTISIPIKVPGDANFRSRSVKVEGNMAVVGGYAAFNTSSDKLVVYDITNPAAPAQARVVQGAGGPMSDFEVHDGWAYIVGDRFTTIDLRNQSSTRNFANVDPCGREFAVTVAGGYAFTAEVDCANNGRVFVYDVTNPAAPIFLGSQDVAGVSNHFFTDLIPYGTDYLIGLSTADSQRDLIIIDRRDPNNLRKVSELQLLSQATAFHGKLVGTTLYIAGLEQGVAMVDVSNPGAPVLMSSIDTPGQAAGVEASGSTVMIADRGDGITFLDASTGALRISGVQSTGADAFDVALGGSNLYVANEVGLFVIANVVAPPDIEPAFMTPIRKDATTATVIGRALSVGGQPPLNVSIRNDTTRSTTTPVAANADGSFAIDVAAQSGNRLAIIVTDALGRTASDRVGTVPFATVVSDQPGHDPDLAFYARRLVTDGTNAILSNGTVAGSRLTSSGRAFIYKGQAPPAAPQLAPYDTGIAIDGAALIPGHALFVGDRFSSLQYASAQPSHSIATTDPCGREVAVAVVGTRAYTAEADCANNGTIFIYDITSLVNDLNSTASPIFVRQQAMASTGGIVYRDLIAAGNYLIAIGSDPSRDVTIIDVSNPASLVRVKELDIPNFSAVNGSLDGTTLYLTGGDAGVAIVDIGNPSAPQTRAVIDTPGIARSLAVLNSNEIVVADAAGFGLTFIDTTNPATPVLLGSQTVRGNPIDVKFAAGLIWVATETRLVVLQP